MWATLRRDVNSFFARDPAARSVLEVVLCYPGLHALWFYRLAHWLWVRRFYLLGRWVSHVGRFFTGIEIYPGAQISPGLVIDHGMGVVIGETAEVGDDVMMYHGVTLGGTTLDKGKRHPTIGDRVTIGAGAKILGPIVVGSDSRIGANAVVVKDVPPDSVAVGVPGRVRGHDAVLPDPGDIDLHHDILPDATMELLQALSARVAALEAEIAELRQERERVG